MAKKKKHPGIDAHRGKWRYRFKAPGRPRVVITTGLEATDENLEVVKRLRDAHRARLLLGEPEPVRAVRCSEAIETFLAWKRAKHRDRPSTAQRVAVSLKSWEAFAGRRLLDEITPADVQDYMTWRRQTAVREVTLRKDLLAVRMLCEFGRARRWLDGDPLAGIEMPSDRLSRNELVLTREEVTAYLAVADLHHSLGDLARLMLNQGLRPNSEALQIRVEHVDLERGELYVPRSKSEASERKLHLVAESRSILARRIEAAPGPWAFPGMRMRKGVPRRYQVLADRPMSYSGLLNEHERVLRRVRSSGAICPEFTLYSLRHTFATWFYDHSHDLIALQTILGHANLRTVERYVNDNQRRALEAMKRYEAGPRWDHASPNQPH